MRSLIIVLTISSSVIFGQPKIIKLADLQSIITTKSDRVQVINFWATWCGPCVRELPLIEKLGQERDDVRVTLVSLDLDLDENPEKVYKFVERKGLQSEVLILDERDSNSWIDKIDKNWSGSLPATIVINTNTGKRKFVGQELKEGELEKLIESVK